MNVSLYRTILMLGAAAMATPAFAQAEDAPPPGPPPPEGQADQAPPPPRARGERMIHGLQTKLGLSDAQVTQVKAIFKAQMQQMKALRDDDSLSNEDRRAKATALRESIRTQIRAILTPDQQKIFDSLPPPRMHRGGPPGEEGGPPPEPPPPPT